MTTPSRPEGGSTPPDATREKLPSFGEVFNNVEFTRDDPSQPWKSSASDRKMIVLDESSSIEAEPGKKYDVQVIDETHPTKRDKGKMKVKIVGIDGVPLSGREAREARRYPLPIEVDHQRGIIRILDVVIKRRSDAPPFRMSERFRHYALDARVLKILRGAADGMAQKNNVMLEGPPGASKTSIFELLAHLMGEKLHRFDPGSRTDESDMIGRYVPNDGKLSVKLHELIKHEDLLTSESRAVIHKAHQEGRELEKIEAQKIAKNEGIAFSEWIWQELKVLQALEQGGVLLIDEYLKISPDVRERFNTLLEEGNRSFTVSERDGFVYGDGPEADAPIPDNLYICLATNPSEYGGGREPLTQPESDRISVQMEVVPPTAIEYIAQLKLWVYGEQPVAEIDGKKYQADSVPPLFANLEKVAGMREFLDRFGAFHHAFEGLIKDKKIGKTRRQPYSASRRKLHAFMKYLDSRKLFDPETDRFKDVGEDPDKVVKLAFEQYYVAGLRNDDDRNAVETLRQTHSLSET
ncbi:MAG: AAA family ATPase, partial [Patescibacteria group bacterium]